MLILIFLSSKPKISFSGYESFLFQDNFKKYYTIEEHFQNKGNKE